MYDWFVERRKNHYTQQVALQPLTIGAADHSHKITKHISRVNGEQVFIGLHTVTNEFSEIRACHLVTTKGHSQTLLALNGIKKSMDLYGLEPPKVFYTDNMADKGLLETVFPSLLVDVVPPETYGHLDELEIPDDVHVYVRNGVGAINSTIQAIMDDLSPDGTGQIVVGFDSEWNVEESANGRLRRGGKTAIVQLAYKKQVYILQIADIIAEGSLPAQLKAFLADCRILKVGRLVNSDLKRLEQACGSTTPFGGGVDLAKVAKDHCVLSSIKTATLGDLCAIVLNKRINKNVPERLSELWESEILTPRQLKYAAIDAYASLCIYYGISKFGVPQSFPMSSLPPPATPVLLYSADKSRIIAIGQISLHSLASSFDGIKLSPLTAVIDIFHVMLPGAKLATHRKRCLQDFGATPFTVVVSKSLLRIYHQPLSSTQNVYALPLKDRSPQSLPPEPTQMGAGLLPSEYSAIGVSHSADNVDGGAPFSSGQLGSSVGDIILGNIDECAEDHQSATEGAEILGDRPVEWRTEVRSRVLKDVFHVFNMFYLSVKHGLRVAFCHALRDAIFLADPEDVRRISAWGMIQKPPQSFRDLTTYRPKWVWKHCKRVIPPPEILYPRVRKVFETFGSLKDATTGLPLFDTNSWKISRNILDLIYHGHISDPPGVPLYAIKGLDQDTGLPVYHCFRGTNRTEGGVHTHLRPHLPSSGTSIRHAQACLMDFVLRHNLTVGIYNRTGKRYRGHFSIWVTNEIQELTTFLRDILIEPPESDGWINGNAYIQTSEVIGVLPIPEQIRVESGMREYDSSLDSRRKHQFLAELQGVCKAVLPVHNPKEKTLFRELVQGDPGFNGPGKEPNWKGIVKSWNRIADGDDGIFYKLTEQLKTYHAHWKVNVNIKATLSLTEDERHHLRALLLGQVPQEAVPRVLERRNPPPTANQGFLALETNDTHHHVTVPEHALGNATAAASIPLPLSVATPPAVTLPNGALGAEEGG
ncbi:hypothetical protein EST38_g9477 [Candolleomyces aberdarensis]|uniref:3'-5' exonuclease n=1 Tax=Candolleomyces aberdarensis TaxID=2316362 RepID=A0A4V1Q2V2_9AGAR|nr:hypothetical protein EST38_g9477 [Candolleomyces aberdarensis]